MTLLATDVQGEAATIGASPVVTTLPLAHAKAWRLHIVNNHASQTIDAVRLRRRTHAAGPSSDWVSVTTGVPIAAGGVLAVVPDADDCAEELDVELTASGSGTGVALWLAGTL